MEIKQAEFSLSAPMVSMCPKDTKPEYAFIGRSNVGKSSLINMLTNNRKLAKTSATPGKTLLINHFIINKEWYLVDLPGYGYAKRSKKEVDKLDQMIRGYILQREQLVNVFVLVDIRLEPQKIDLEFIEWLGVSGIPFSIVFTKADAGHGGETAGAKEPLGCTTILYLFEEGFRLGSPFGGEWLWQGCSRQSGALYGGAYHDACLAHECR